MDTLMSYGKCYKCKDGNLLLHQATSDPKTTLLKCDACTRVFVGNKCEHCADRPYLQKLTLEETVIDVKLRCPACGQMASYKTYLGTVAQVSPAIIASGVILRFVKGWLFDDPDHHDPSDHHIDST